MNHLDSPDKGRLLSRALGFAAASLFVLGLAGCGDGSDGAPGAPGAPGQNADPAVVADLQAQIDAIVKSANPETCVTCHAGTNPLARTGPDHQKRYAEFYQDGVVKVSNMAFGVVGGTTATLTFKMTKNGAPFDCTKPTGSGSDFAIGSYWAEYNLATKTFPSDMSLTSGSGASKSYDAGTNTCTFRNTVNAGVAAKMAGNGIVQIYGVDEILETDPEKHMSNGKYPFAGVLKLGNVDYSTAANVTGCENCHTKPYLKHAYIYGTVLDQNNQPTEFYTCKGCHYDERNGGHPDWQLLKDDPARFAALSQLAAAAAAAGDTSKNTVAKNMTAAELAKYAYKAKLMNDVHMSHAMEFAYPQSMKNCVTCHKNKLNSVLADTQFKAETCKSCHAVDGLVAKMTAKTTIHTNLLGNLDAANCTVCHVANGAGPTFKTIHNGGYDPAIYSSTGVRYSDTFIVKIDAASVSNNKLTISFSATGSTTSPALSATSITPTVLVGLYGYDSKDFIVAAHGRDADRNRLLEYEVGTTNPRFTTVKNTGGSWEVTADLSMWADKIASGAIKRAEIAVMPELKNAAGMVLGLNAPSRTFDLAANRFDDAFFKDIVDVKNGCNTCHDQLATTFHSGTRGGNIKVCRICHEVSSAGSHLELQSRSIDSYVHAIHSFQAFDPGDINFGDPVESLEYTHHISSSFPRFGILNCESCHLSTSAGGTTPGTPGVPSQAKSMPGQLSGTDAVAGRNIGEIPRAVTGPAVRACGACHRAQSINADDAGKLAIQIQHWKTFGYYLEVADAEAASLWEQVVAKIMAIFK